jgi:hypothetical protein
VGEPWGRGVGVSPGVRCKQVGLGEPWGYFLDLLVFGGLRLRHHVVMWDTGCGHGRMVKGRPWTP